MASSDINDLTSGRALGDLTEAESRELDAALARDQSLTREVDDMREALDVLALDASTEPPPSHLRGNVVAIARTPARRWRLPSWGELGFGVMTAVGAAAVAVAIVLGLRVGDLQQSVDELEAGLATQRTALVEIYAARPHIVTLDGMPGAEGAWARLMFDDAGAQVMLVVDGLHPPSAEHEYQLWLVREGGERVSGALFSTDLAGTAVVVVRSEDPVYVFQAFGVTEEPMGGSPSGPTGSPMLFGEMQ